MAMPDRNHAPQIRAKTRHPPVQPADGRINPDLPKAIDVQAASGNANSTSRAGYDNRLQGEICEKDYVRTRIYGKGRRLSQAVSLLAGLSLANGAVSTSAGVRKGRDNAESASRADPACLNDRRHAARMRIPQASDCSVRIPRRS